MNFPCRQNKEYDQKRTEHLEKLGFYVLRFENTEVNKDIEEVQVYYNDCNSSKRSRVSQKPILSAFSKIVFYKYNFALHSLKGL